MPRDVRHPPNFVGVVPAAGAAAPPGEALHTSAGLVLLCAPVHVEAVRLLHRRAMVVGRDPACDIVLADPSVSRRHARLEFAGGRWTVCDLGSRNGTFVASRPVREQALEPLAEVAFGDCLYKFVAAGAERHVRYPGAVLDPPAGASGARDPGARLVGGHRVQRLASVLRRLAAGAVDVLLVGEPGTEKEACARMLHAMNRRRGPFLRFDRALPGGGVEVAATCGGTIFVDDMGAGSDVAELARALERIASSASADVPWSRDPYRSAPPASLDVRVIYGSTRFPADLEAPAPWRHTVAIPPLRERKEDLTTLCRAHLAALGRPDLMLDYWTLRALVAHDYPGNVEELARILAAGASRCPGRVLAPEHLPAEIALRMPPRRSGRPATRF